MKINEHFGSGDKCAITERKGQRLQNRNKRHVTVFTVTTCRTANGKSFVLQNLTQFATWTSLWRHLTYSAINICKVLSPPQQSHHKELELYVEKTNVAWAALQ